MKPFKVDFVINTFFLLLMCSVSNLKKLKIKSNHSESKVNSSLVSNDFENVLNILTNNIIKDKILAKNIRIKRNFLRVKELYINEILDLKETPQSKNTSDYAFKFYETNPSNDESIMNLDREQLFKDQNSTEKIVNLTFNQGNSKGLKMIDVAAGTGRNIINVFYKYFSHIDAVEPTPNYEADLRALKNDFPQIENVYNEKVQEFQFKDKYDLIFNEGLLDVLTDIELLKYLVKARNALKDNGVLFIKENTPYQLRSEKLNNFYLKETNQKIRPLEINLLLFRLTGYRPILIKPIYSYYDDEFMNSVPMFEYLLEKDE